MPPAPTFPKAGRLGLLHRAQWALEKVAARTVPEYRPRPYHNVLLRRYLGGLGGDVINVSGWEDRDKEGGRYRDYFGRVDRYVVSNIHGDRGMPPSLPPDVESLFLDLEQPVPAELEGRFDVVLNHTVLEHVYETEQALENLAALSRDVVAVVVPWSQAVHYTSSFSDYVRLSPFKLRRFFEGRGFGVLLCAANEQSFFDVYVTMIVSRHPERHAEAFRGAPQDYDVQIRPGRRGRYRPSGVPAPPR